MNDLQSLRSLTLVQTLVVSAIGVIAIVGGVYILRKLDVLSAEATKKPAEWFFSLLNPISVADTLEGGVYLPSGEYVTWENVVQDGSKLDSSNRFTYQGIAYRVLARMPGEQAYRAVIA